MRVSVQAGLESQKHLAQQKTPLVKREVIRDTDNIQHIEPYWPGSISLYLLSAASFSKSHTPLQNISIPVIYHFLNGWEFPYEDFQTGHATRIKLLVLLQPKSGKVSPGYKFIIFWLNQHISRYLKMPSGFGEQLRLKWPNFSQHYLCCFREREKRWLHKGQILAFIPSTLAELSRLVWKVFIFP